MIVVIVLYLKDFFLKKKVLNLYFLISLVMCLLSLFKENETKWVPKNLHLICNLTFSLFSNNLDSL